MSGRQSFCEQCGARLVAGNRFCETCGLPIGGPAPTSAISAVAPADVTLPSSSPPLSPSSRPRSNRARWVAAVSLVLAAAGGWWWWSHETAADPATPRSGPAASTAMPATADSAVADVAVTDSVDATYRDAVARYDRAYAEYTRLMSTGGDGNVQVALQEYRAAYAAMKHIDSLRKERVP